MQKMRDLFLRGISNCCFWLFRMLLQLSPEPGEVTTTCYTPETKNLVDEIYKKMGLKTKWTTSEDGTTYTVVATKA